MPWPARVEPPPFGRICIIDYRLLGRSGLKVSALSIGTVTFGNDGSWGSTELKDAQRQIDLCLDHGVNLIDT